MYNVFAQETPMTLDAGDPARPVASPCIGICCIGHDGLCFGCYRNRAELSAWSKATEQEKREILARCRVRQGQLP
ncbi:MAG: DUF1289 domain-containing protein [Gammaproteobacteria bacterium]